MLYRLDAEFAKSNQHLLTGRESDVNKENQPPARADDSNKEKEPSAGTDDFNKENKPPAHADDSNKENEPPAHADDSNKENEPPVRKTKQKNQKTGTEIAKKAKKKREEAMVNLRHQAPCLVSVLVRNAF